MPTDDGEWPELGEELAYKCLDALQDRVWEWQNGLITAQDVVLVAKTITETTQGLIPWSAGDLIYKVRKYMERQT